MDGSLHKAMMSPGNDVSVLTVKTQPQVGIVHIMSPGSDVLVTTVVTQPQLKLFTSRHIVMT